MARSRNLKPGFFVNDKLAEVSPLGRILFQGLWCFADREGRLEDRPRKLKAEIVPYDDCDVNALLDDLAEHGFIVRYEHDNCRYIQVVNFGKHQNPHMKEGASVIPAPIEHQTSMVQEPDKNSSSPADSLSLDSLSLEEPKPSCAKDCAMEPNANRTQARQRLPEDHCKKPKPAEPEADPGFTRFWEAYPRKVSKREAAKVWRSVNPGEFGTIMQALSLAKESEQWVRDSGRFVPHAATWIRGRRWEDEGMSCSDNPFRGAK